MSKRRINTEIKRELDRIKTRSRDGRLHWEDVVRWAREKSSPLHSYFDFSQKTALEHYLRAQAEELISSYTVVVQTDAGDRVRTRAFVSLSTDRRSGGGYRAIIDVLSDSELKQRLLDDALADLSAFKQRYGKLKELVSIFESIEKLEQRHGTRKAKATGRGTSRPSLQAQAIGV